jgi:hypothetical protein
MPMFHITWEIDIDADTAREAAEKAHAMVRACGTTATVYDVIEEGRADCLRIDLLGDPGDDHII